MPKIQRVGEFARKWAEKFNNPSTDYHELVEYYLADDCANLGFVMDCGHSFSERYGAAVHNCNELRRIIEDVHDIQLLGSAIYSRWRYFNHWAYSGEDILSPENREWFIIALMRLEELADENPLLFHGQLQKMRLVSNSICYGPSPEPDDEVEQRLTISATGRVWFSSYKYGTVPGKYQLVEKRMIKIAPRDTQRLLAVIEGYFSRAYTIIEATDIGRWSLTLTNTEGLEFRYHGALCSDRSDDGMNLSDCLRNVLLIDGLYAFDGNWGNEDEAD